MTETSLHPGLELRLKTLAARINKLRQRLKREKGFERLLDLGEVLQLERRQKRLSEKLGRLDRKGAGSLANAAAEIEKKIDDVAGTIEDFIIRLDRAYAANSTPSKLTPKPSSLRAGKHRRTR